MMTLSNGNIFRVTGPLCGEFTGPGEFPTQRPVTRSFGVFFDLRLNKRLSKQSWGWWFETPSWSLWRQWNAIPTQWLLIIPGYDRRVIELTMGNFISKYCQFLYSDIPIPNCFSSMIWQQVFKYNLLNYIQVNPWKCLIIHAYNHISFREDRPRQINLNTATVMGQAGHLIWVNRPTKYPLGFLSPFGRKPRVKMLDLDEDIVNVLVAAYWPLRQISYSAAKCIRRFIYEWMFGVMQTRTTKIFYVIIP